MPGNLQEEGQVPVGCVPHDHDASARPARQCCVASSASDPVRHCVLANLCSTWGWPRHPPDPHRQHACALQPQAWRHQGKLGQPTLNPGMAQTPPRSSLPTRTCASTPTVEIFSQALTTAVLTELVMRCRKTCPTMQPENAL